jgi:hypothetical protein
MIKLLPSGGFEITLKEGKVIKGKYSAAALKKLSLMNGGLGFSETLDLITTNATLNNFLQLVLCAAEGDYNEFDVLEWVEQLGGFNSEDCGKLFAHFMDGFVGKKKAEADQ